VAKWNPVTKLVTQSNACDLNILLFSQMVQYNLTVAVHNGLNPSENMVAVTSRDEHENQVL
jgi:hypothetical protein